MRKEHATACLAALEDVVYRAALGLVEASIPRLKEVLAGRFPSSMEFDDSDPQNPVLCVTVGGDSYRIQLKEST